MYFREIVLLGALVVHLGAIPGPAISDEEVHPMPQPNLQEQRRAALNQAELRFESFVFDTVAFPAVDFAQPALVKELLGAYTLRTVFYDAEYHPVESARQPGRYGAIVEVSTAEGPLLKRFFTLFRRPEAIPWEQVRLPAPIPLLEAMGIAPAVLRDREKMLEDLFRWKLWNLIQKDEQSAILLAGLYETPPGTPPQQRYSPWVQNSRWWYGLKRQTGDASLPRYLLYVPPDYAADPARKWPLLLFLHGAGERGDDLEKVKVHGPPRLIAEGQHFPFIVVSPQCPEGEWWLPAQLIDLVEDICSHYRVDPDRIYLTGLSMGGYGTWATAIEYPDRFAAIAPICGGGDPEKADRIRHIPAWVFHGAKDPVVPLAQSEAMVRALEQLGAEVRFTVYPEATHDSWTETYANPELYEWLLQHPRKGHEG
jgi:predicted esterase